jgi:leucyl aminopeptidase
VEFSIKSGSPEKQRTACVVAGVFESRKLTLPAELLDKAAGGYISEIVRRGDMDGKAGSTLLLQKVPGTLCERVLLVGLGKEKGASVRLRRLPSTALINLSCSRARKTKTVVHYASSPFPSSTAMNKGRLKRR